MASNKMVLFKAFQAIFNLKIKLNGMVFFMTINARLKFKKTFPQLDLFF